MALQSFDKTIAIIGEPGVGKSQLIQRYIYNDYNPLYVVSLGIEPHDKTIVFPKHRKQVHMVVWDTIGQAKISIGMVINKLKDKKKKGLTSLDGVFVVGDLIHEKRVEAIKNWINFLEFALKQEGLKWPIPIVILMNKADLIKHKNLVSWIDSGGYKKFRKSLIEDIFNIEKKIDRYKAARKFEKARELEEYRDAISNFENFKTDPVNYEKHVKKLISRSREISKELNAPIYFTSPRIKNDKHQYRQNMEKAFREMAVMLIKEN